MKEIRSNTGEAFSVNDYSEASSGYTFGLGPFGVEYSGNRNNPRYQNGDFKFAGVNYGQMGMSTGIGIDAGLMWSRTNTRFIGF